jgi:hypothetical protein
MFIADFFQISLDSVQTVDQIQGDIGAPGFAFRQSVEPVCQQ